MRALRHYIAHLWLVLLMAVLWQMLAGTLISPLLLPAPSDIMQAFAKDFPLLAMHARHTLITAFVGIGVGIVLAFVLAILMDLSKNIHRALYPLLLVNQTVPSIAIAPLLVIWLGYGILPKVVLVVLGVLFPMLMAWLEGFGRVSVRHINLFRSFRASRYQLYRHAKIPMALPSFFMGLKVAMSYALISAVIAEWLGGNYGLGVYMTRARKSFALDKMFAVIFLVVILTFLLIFIIDFLQKKCVRGELK